MNAFPLLPYLAVWVAGGLVTAAAVPFWQRVCPRLGLVDDPGHRKIHATPTPLAGGLAVFTGLLVVVLGGSLAVALGAFDSRAAELLQYGLSRRAVPLAAILLGAAGMLLLGLLDDRRELGAGAKFTGQFLIALLVAVAGVRITLFVPSLLFSYAVTVLWILTVTNAMNFNDNMNGLCGGLGCIAAASFGLAAARHGQYLVALLALLVAGCLLGYLPYNYPRARVFLGDSGSHLVGYLLAVLAILPHFYSPKLSAPRPWAVLSPLIILAVPLLDLATVVIVRTAAGRPFWIGDTNHFSHRLVRAGLSRPQAVLVLWICAAAGGALSLR